LANASELTKLLGEARSELFHYEVRATYDTPEVAESRRIVVKQLASRLAQQLGQLARVRQEAALFIELPDALGERAEDLLEVSGAPVVVRLLRHAALVVGERRGPAGA
jgi:hypothetical protein